MGVGFPNCVHYQVVEARRHVADHNQRVAAGECSGAAPIAPISNIVFMVGGAFPKV